jgi:hypothetical protein
MGVRADRGKSVAHEPRTGVTLKLGARANSQSLQYVKICSLYGAGFYYIPGTDTCIKIGGWARAEYTYGDNGHLTFGGLNGNVNNRTTNNSTWRVRGYITADARSQTDYGTLRSYMAVGFNTNTTGTDSASNTFSANRAFIQWAGFTFGLSQSFYDFYSNSATGYWASILSSDTGDPGWEVAAYTAQFGNGFSASISAEMRRMTEIVHAGTTPLLGGNPTSSFPGGGYGGFNVPDIVGNLRVDQAWGSAQVMGALHEVNGTYFGATQNSGGPDNRWGFAVGGGLKLNAPMLGHGDFLQTQVNYAQGASRYVVFSPEFNYYNQKGSEAAYGVLSDGVFGGTGTSGTDIQLTTAWGVDAAYQHFWSPAWRTSVYGGYASFNYGSQANAMLCAAESAGNGSGIGSGAIANPGCDNDWNVWWVGSRTQWNLTKDFYMGLDVLYQKLDSASAAANAGVGPPAAGQAPLATSATDMDNWQFRFRVHRDFYP